VTEQERRDAVRRRYDERCGYCGVHESEAGTLLEIDHFQPRAVGGTDTLDNLVYCCPTCNRLKGGFWPSGDHCASEQRLLHPERDDLSLHLREEANCRLSALTATGAFHLNRLRLNRPPLVALRRARKDVELLRRALDATHTDQALLRDRMTTLENDLQQVLLQLSRLGEP
jgi:hypothetical protein